MNAPITLACPECDTDLGPDITFEPDVPPVPCSNPDSPAYSDPGSIGGIDGVPDRCPKCGVAIDIDWAHDTAREQFEEQQAAAAEDAALAKLDDDMDGGRYYRRYYRGRRW